MDISNVLPDTIITEEMLKPKQEEFMLVIEHYNKINERILYMGNVEFEAYKKYKNIKHKNKVVVKALIVYSDFFKEKYGTEFILDYKIISFLK